MFKKIVVGVDFSDKSDRAVRGAVGLAKAIGAGVVIVHVVPALAEVSAATSGTLQPTMEHRLREEAAKVSAASGINVDYGVQVGSVPADELLKFVDNWGGDLLVVGTAGRTGVGRVLIGSVAEQLLARSKVPVLVVGPQCTHWS